MLMDEAHRHGTLARRVGDSLDGAGADIASRKDPGEAGFEQQRRSSSPTSLARAGIPSPLRDEALLVALHQVFEPVRSRA